MKHALLVLLVSFSANLLAEKLPDTFTIESSEDKHFQINRGESLATIAERLSGENISFAAEKVDDILKVLILDGDWWMKDFGQFSESKLMLRFHKDRLAGFTYRYGAGERKKSIKKIQEQFGKNSRKKGKQRAWYLRNGFVSVESKKAKSGERYSALNYLWWAAVSSADAKTIPTARVGDPGVEPPVFITRAAPKYPESAIKDKIQGHVVLEAVLTVDGDVENIKVISPLDETRPEFAEEAARALKKWVYIPGKVDGEPTNVNMILKLDFILE